MSDEPPKSGVPENLSHPLLPQAVALHRAGRLEDAAEIYLKILSAQPRDFDATHLLGVAALQQGRFDVAQQFINAALSINPHDVAAMGNLGTSYLRNGQLESALQWFEIARTLQPDSPIVLTNTGTALHHMGRSHEAIPILRRAYAADPNSYALCNLLGACLIKNGETHEAAELFEAATAAEPGNAEGWANLSVALNALGRHGEARDCADRAVALKPESSTALGALGAAQFDQGRLTEAMESYRQGVALPAPSAQMLLGFSNVLLASGLNEEAMEQLRRAILLDAKNLTARWACAMACLKPIYRSTDDMLSSRQNFAQAVDDVAAWYRGAEGVHEPYNAVGVSQPFYLAYQPFNNRDLLIRYGTQCSLWMTTLPRDGHPTGGLRVRAGQSPERSGRLRIGIASAHIHEHSVWNAITRGWVYQIDPTRFELSLFQLNPTSDAETERARRAVTVFEDEPTGLPGWVDAIRRQELDVLIYPEIGMDPLTVRLASLRLAPLQAATWGHPETTGLPTMDLYISADALEPVHAADNYSERLVKLPNLGVYVEPLAPVIMDPGLRALNLPGNEPLLLCPGSPFKYSPQYDELWVEIAKHLTKRMFRGGGGRLVFFRSRSDPMDRMLESRLRAAFERAGVDFGARACIIPTLDRARFFGLMRESALMLDTPGFSGFNTALQAIECDLPVLAFEGEFMRGRLASGIMRQLDLPELVATSREEFIRTAIELAADPGRRKNLRAKIIERRKVLFHDLAPVRALESHLTDAVAKSRAAGS